MAIPYIDPDVMFVGATFLRELNTERLQKAEKTVVIQDNGKPLAVLMPYEVFMEMQTVIIQAQAGKEK